MANPWRGEIEVEVDGATRTLRLSLGALAELEASLGAESLADLAERFETGGLRGRDVIRVLAAGFRGAGEAVSEEAVGEMGFADGAVGAAKAAGRLLSAAFTGREA